MSLWIVIFPFDVVKSRMQIQQINMSMVSLLVKISQDEGMIPTAGCWSCEVIVVLVNNNFLVIFCVHLKFTAESVTKPSLIMTLKIQHLTCNYNKLLNLM